MTTEKDISAMLTFYADRNRRQILLRDRFLAVAGDAARESDTDYDIRAGLVRALCRLVGDRHELSNLLKFTGDGWHNPTDEASSPQHTTE